MYNKNIITIMGGVYATISPEIVMDDINLDYAILGEGEERLPKLLELLNKKNEDYLSFDGLGYRDSNKVIINSIKTYI